MAFELKLIERLFTRTSSAVQDLSEVYYNWILLAKNAKLIDNAIEMGSRQHSTLTVQLVGTSSATCLTNFYTKRTKEW